MYVPWLALGCATMQSNARNREAIESEGRQMNSVRRLLCSGGSVREHGAQHPSPPLHYRGVRGAHGGQRPRGHPSGAPARPYSGVAERRRPLGWIPRGRRQAAGGASATTEAGATLGASYGGLAVERSSGR